MFRSMSMRKWEPKWAPKMEPNRLWGILGPTLGAQGASNAITFWHKNTNLPTAWLLPMRWYWLQLGFPHTPASFAHPSGAAVAGGITWLELLLDFEMATRVLIASPGKPITSLSKKASLFADASRKLFRICNGHKFISAYSDALTHFGGIRAGGLPVRPALCNPVHVFTELAHQARVHRNSLTGRANDDATITPQWSWSPIYQHLPVPQWQGEAIQQEQPRRRFRIMGKTSHHVPPPMPPIGGLGCVGPSLSDCVSPVFFCCSLALPRVRLGDLWCSARGAEKGGSKMVRKLDLKKGGFWIKKVVCRRWGRRNVRRSWALFLADFKQELANNFTRSAPTGAADCFADAHSAGPR